MFESSQFTELKLKVTKDLKKEIVAFANSNDGTIYIGIDDNGKVVGLKNAKKNLETISSMIHDNIKSDLTLNTKLYIEKINKKDIIVIKICEGDNKPYYITEKGLKPAGVYLRFGNTSIQATEEGIKKLLIESNSKSFESNISQNQNLHFDYLIDAFKKINVTLDNNKFKSLHILNSDNLFKISLYNINYDNEFDSQNVYGGISMQENVLIRYLKMNNFLNRITAESLLGLSKTRTNGILKNMINSGILYRNDSGKNTYYQLKK